MNTDSFYYAFLSPGQPLSPLQGKKKTFSIKFYAGRYLFLFKQSMHKILSVVLNQIQESIDFVHILSGGRI